MTRRSRCRAGSLYIPYRGLYWPTLVVVLIRIQVEGLAPGKWFGWNLTWDMPSTPCPGFTYRADEDGKFGGLDRLWPLVDRGASDRYGLILLPGSLLVA